MLQTPANPSHVPGNPRGGPLLEPDGHPDPGGLDVFHGGPRGETLTVNQAATIQNLYDWVQYNLTLDANRGVGQWLSTIDGLNFTATYSLVLNAPLTGTAKVVIATGNTLTLNSTTSLVFTSDAGTTGYLTLAVPAGSSVAVYDQTGSRVAYTAVSGTQVTTFIPPAVTGAYTFKVAKYGYFSVTGSQVVTGGGYFSSALTQSVDPTVVDSLANVVAYTFIERNHGPIGWKRWLLSAVLPTLLAMSLACGLLLLKQKLGWY